MWSPGFQASGRVTAPLPRATEARPEQSFNFFLPPVWGTHSKPRNQSSVSFYTMWLSRCIFLNRNFQICVSENGKDSFSQQCYHCSKYFEAFFLELSSEEVTSRGGREVACFIVLPHFWLKMVLASMTPLPWPLPVALSCFWLFPDLISMVRGNGFVSAELKIGGHDHQREASEAISLKGAKIIISLCKW